MWVLLCMYIKYVNILITFWFCLLFVNRITEKLHMNFCEISEYEFGMMVAFDKTNYMMT